MGEHTVAERPSVKKKGRTIRCEASAHSNHRQSTTIYQNTSILFCIKQGYVRTQRPQGEKSHVGQLQQTQ